MHWRIQILTALIVLPLFTGWAQASEFQIILSGREAGQQTVTYHADGSAEFFYEFNDRGRGDSITSKIRLNEQGIPIAIHNTGNDYMKTPVDERFSIEGEQARWQSLTESHTHTLDGAAFYLPLNGAPEVAGILARALLKAENHRLAILPAGEARIVKDREITVHIDNQAHAITLYFIEGLGFSPEGIWLDQDLRTFATASPWFSVIPAAANHEDLIPELLAAQDAALLKRSKVLVEQLSTRPAGDVLIHNARLYDPRDLSVRDGSSVLIRGQRIIAVGPDASLAEHDAAMTIDAAERFLMPGLWDSHQHFGDTTGLMDLASGVTSARDLANDNDSMLARTQRFKEGLELGPRIFLGGFMDGPGPLAGPTKVLVDTVEEATEWVNWYGERDYRQIKVYSSLKPELVAPIARAAHAQGMRLSGHVPAFMSAEEFVRAGADEIQHINMLFLNFLTDSAPDTRDMTRFTAVAEHAMNIHPDDPAVAAFIQLLQERHTVIDPTIGIFEGMFSGEPNSPPPGMSSYLPRVPPQVSRGWLSGALQIPEGLEENYRQAMPALMRMLKALHDADITLVAGTDAMPGFALYRELALYVDAGLSPVAALRTATLNPARVMGVDHKLGVPAPGALADLILIDGRPDEDITQLDRVRTVIKGGVIYQAAEMQKALGIQPVE